jgi:hypothetical protein
MPLSEEDSDDSIELARIGAPPLGTFAVGSSKATLSPLLQRKLSSGGEKRSSVLFLSDRESQRSKPPPPSTGYDLDSCFLVLFSAGALAMHSCMQQRGQRPKLSVWAERRRTSIPQGAPAIAVELDFQAA